MSNGTGTLPFESSVYVCEANVTGATKCKQQCDVSPLLEELKITENTFYMDYLNAEDCIFNAEALLDNRGAMKELLEDDPKFFSHLVRLAIQKSEEEPLTEEWITSTVIGTAGENISGVEVIKMDSCDTEDGNITTPHIGENGFGGNIVCDDAKDTTATASVQPESKG